MNTIMGLSRADCKGCYKCIRSCPVKSLSCRDEQVQVVDGECIYCGRCLLICPQNAKYIRNDLPRVQDAVRAGEKVYASLDPSCMAAFPGVDMGKMFTALHALGFVHAESVTAGAKEVTRAYDRLSAGWQQPNFITTACPSVYLLVQRHYPQLVAQLAPAVSFAAAHARILRQVYGPRAKVVSIGPCISQKYDAADAGGLFAALTFDELRAWFAEADVNPAQMKPHRAGAPETDYAARPGGVIHQLAKSTRAAWECVAVDGVARCTEVLDSITKDGLSGYLLELTACAGGCLGGPILRMMNVPYLTAKDALVRGAREARPGPALLTDGVTADVSRSFRRQMPHRAPVSEERILEVLARTGKTSPKQELNCGSCGYNTCREKAVAVLHGKANVSMCVPYMRELAESMSTSVVENIPTGVLVLNSRLLIEHINPAALRLLKVQGEVCGRSVAALMQSDDFYQVLSTGKDILRHNQRYDPPGVVVSQTVVSLPSTGGVIVLLEDITHVEEENERRRRLAEETAQFAREVVDKQMRAVQQIAGLLGETATETKLALSRLTGTLVEQTEERHDNGGYEAH